MARAFEVVRYSIDELKRLLAEKSGTDRKIIDEKLHSAYFESYFSFDEINAKTIIVENEYIDRDFLEDFAAYYVRCFTKYPKTCTRLHFFSIAFKSRAFKNLLRGGNNRLKQEILQRSYLGFVVIKPIPQTVIGRTCLKTYPSQTIGRNFPSTQDYHVNLFGIPLIVKTLAFQEQDTVAAACATSALWSVFQGTGRLFHHHIPSPVEITKFATEHLPLETRAFPNEGLTLEQMAQAICKVGLEPLYISPRNPYVLKANLYAYLCGQIPVLMGVYLYDMSHDPPQQIEGKHAIAVMGFNLSSPPVQGYGNHNFRLRASRIEKVYAHDDQVGPFARMELASMNVKDANGATIDSLPYLTTSWKGDDNKIGSIAAVPDLLLIPLYHKIRIPFNEIHSVVEAFFAFLENIRANGKMPIPSNIEWEIALSTVNEIKKEILASDHIDPERRYDILTQAMPRFVWRASAFSNDTRLLDLLFDATDIKQGQFFVRAIEYDLAISLILRAVSKVSALDAIYSTTQVMRIIEWFRRQPLPNNHK